jgi:hypothetical protein
VDRVLEVTLRLAKARHERVGTLDRLRVAANFRRVGDTRPTQANPNLGRTGYDTRPSFSIGASLAVNLLDLPKTLGFFDRRLAQAYGKEGGLVRKPDGTVLEDLWLT